MSNPPLPAVPSKAALRALRGLVFGTSCTLALIAEDRRRRIDAARSAIRNGERIRAAKQYHAGGAALALALEEEALVVEPSVVHWNRKDGGPPTVPRSRRGQGGLQQQPESNLSGRGTASSQSLFREPHRPRLEEGVLVASAAAAAAAAAAVADGSHSLDHTPSSSRSSSDQPIRNTQAQAQTYPDPFKQLLSEQPTPFTRQGLPRRGGRTAGNLRGEVGKQQPDKPASIQDLGIAVERIAEGAKDGWSANLDQPVKMLLQIPADSLQDANELYRQLLEVSITLCNTCQGAGRIDLAEAVLRFAVRHMNLDEESYFAFNPLPVVESLLPPLTEPAEGGDTKGDDAFLEQLRAAASLFLPDFSWGPRTRPAEDLADVARQLLERAFAVRNMKYFKRVYSAVIKHPGDISDLTYWYLARLQDNKSYNMLVRTFLARPPRLLEAEAFNSVGDMVVKALGLSLPARAGDVLRTLADMGDGRHRLRTTWATELLYQYWKKSHNLEETKALFDELFKDNISDKVFYPDGIYRVMIQISLEAEDMQQAESFLADLVALDAGAEHEIRITALFALRRAKMGDWAGVRDMFERAADQKKLKTEHSERVFVPILKEYLKGHTMGETEEFLKTYVDELGLPLCRDMVTMLAKEYGAVRDVKSFTGWLEYCSKAGFKVDAAFSNAILANCRKNWGFCFRELRALFRKLGTLSPNFQDGTTRRIMMNAAISDPRVGRRATAGRILSLKVKPNVLHAAGRSADEHDVLLAMKHAFVAGNMPLVVTIYKRATRAGMPPCGKCLKLAVGAAVRGKQPRPDTAMELLRAAQAAGQEIDAAAVYVALAHLDAIDRKAGKDKVLQAMRSVLRQFEASRLRISHLALDRAAFHLYRAGHLTGAVSFALSAAEQRGSRPGYNGFNFSVLLAAFSGLSDAGGIRMAVDGAAEAHVLDRTMCYRALKEARRKLRACVSDHEVAMCISAVEAGLERARGAREKLRAERGTVEAAAMDIMRRAALEEEADSSPVDSQSEAPRPKAKRRSTSKSHAEKGKQAPQKGLEQADLWAADVEAYLGLGKHHGGPLPEVEAPA